MKLLIAHEKHGKRYFRPGTDKTLLDPMMNLIQERYHEGWYEETIAEGLAKDMLDAYFEQGALREIKDPDLFAVAWEFLSSRNNYEYEKVTIEETEN